MIDALKYLVTLILQIPTKSGKPEWCCNGNHVNEVNSTHGSIATTIYPNNTAISNRVGIQYEVIDELTDRPKPSCIINHQINDNFSVGLSLKVYEEKGKEKVENTPCTKLFLISSGSSSKNPENMLFPFKYFWFKIVSNVKLGAVCVQFPILMDESLFRISFWSFYIAMNIFIMSPVPMN